MAKIITPSRTYDMADWAYQHESATKYEPSHMITRADDLDGQVGEMVRQGYVVYGITIATYCAECQGSGRVPKKNARMAHKVCPECKGHDGPIAERRYEV